MTRATLAAAVSLVGLVVACSAPADAPAIPSPTPTAPPGSVNATPTASSTATTPPPELPPLVTTDGGTPTPTTGSCVPATTVTPTTKAWKPPHQLGVQACSAAEASSIAKCFVNGPTDPDCNVPVSQACHSCALSGDATPYSAALIVGATKELNVEGCVAAMSGDPSANGCGPKLVARFECAATACAACTDPAQRTSCLQQADTGVCATQAQAAACAAPYLPQCVQGLNEAQVALNLVRLFCGKP